jgi:hypothetical protein
MVATNKSSSAPASTATTTTTITITIGKKGFDHNPTLDQWVSLRAAPAVTIHVVECEQWLVWLCKWILIEKVVGGVQQPRRRYVQCEVKVTYRFSSANKSENRG